MLNQSLVNFFKTDSKITNITVLSDDSIAVSTKAHGVTIFSLSACKVKQNLSITLLGDKTTATAFSKEHRLFAFANATTIYIINLQNKTTIQTIQTDEGAIEILSFVQNSPYLICGTKEGDVSQYRYDGKSQLSRLCSFPILTTKNGVHVKNSYVSAFAFSETHIASSGYGGAIILLKINSLANKQILHTSKVRINKLLFVDNETLISGNVDGIIEIHSLKKSPTCRSINTPFTQIRNIISLPNKKYIVVSGESEKLILIDRELAKVVSNHYLVFEHKIEQIILLSKEQLLVGLESHELIKVELTNAKEINSYILHNSLDKAYKLIENDPMLQGTKEHKKLEKLYENIRTQIINELIDSNTKKALQLAEMFEGIESKKDEINAIFKAYKNYPRFQTLYLEKKYALVYAMCEKYPSLKQTQEFQQMEESFKEAFASAHKQIQLGREDIAKELLSPYATVIVKKPIIKLLLNNNRDFLRFLKALQKSEFSLIEELVKKNEIFTQIPTYKAFKKSLLEALEKIEESINRGTIDDAVAKIKKLQERPSIQKELKELYATCKAAQELQESYKENNFIRCYELLDKNSNLEKLQLAKLLERHWSQSMQRCEEFALNGDIKSIKNELQELIRVPTRLKKVGDLLRVSFHTKIKNLLRKNRFTYTENMIYSYIDIFGIDSQVRLLMKAYEERSHKNLAITLNHEKTLSRDAWLHSTLIMDN